MFKKVSLCLIIGIFFIIETSYSAAPLSLNPLLDEAKKNNPEILAAAKRYEAAKTRIPQAKSLDDPVIGISFQRTKGSPFQLQTTPSDERMLSITQAFPSFGKLSLKGKIALIESQMAAAEYKNTQLKIIDSVKNAYYELFMNYKEIGLNQDSIIFLQNLEKIAESRYAVGKVPQEDLFKINTEIAQLNNEIVNLKQENSAKKTLLNTLLDRQPESLLGIPELSEDTSFNIGVDNLYKLTIENQPELLAFSYAIERNKYAHSLAKRNFFPDFIAGITERGFTTGTIGPWDLMLAFTVPLWFWTKQRYAVKEAIANVDEAKAAYQAMKNKALAQTKDLAVRIKTARNTINLYKNEQIPLLESSISVSLSAYQSGKGDIMMLLDSERMLIEAKINYYRALMDYNRALADLEFVVGLDLSKNTEVKK
jgi:outer membrane protein TolC